MAYFSRRFDKDTLYVRGPLRANVSKKKKTRAGQQPER